MTGTTAVRTSERHVDSMYSYDSSEIPFDQHRPVLPQQQRLQQEEQQQLRNIMRTPEEELQDGELPSLTKRKKMDALGLSGQRPTQKPLNPPNPAGLKVGREQRQFWGQLDSKYNDHDSYDTDEADYHDTRQHADALSHADDMPEDELMSTHRRRRAVQHDRELDNVSPQDDEFEDASSLGQSNTFETNYSEDMDEHGNLCDQTLTALGDLCGGGAIDSVPKKRPSHQLKPRKLSLPDNAELQEEHTAIEVEFVEPPAGSMSPQKKNAYLTAMARKAKSDFERKKDEAPKGEPQSSVSPQVVADMYAQEEDIYLSFSASEKRKFLKLINSGVPPSQATNQIRDERSEARKAAEVDINKKQVADKKPAPEEDQGAADKLSRTPRLAFWKKGSNNSNNNSGDARGVVGLDNTQESEDSGDEPFSKSGIHYYDGIRKDVSVESQDSIDIPDHMSSSKSNKTPSRRVKSPVGFAALRERRSRSSSRNRKPEQKQVSPRGNSDDDQELEELVARTLAMGSVAATTTPPHTRESASEEDDHKRSLHDERSTPQRVESKQPDSALVAVVAPTVADIVPAASQQSDTPKTRNLDSRTVEDLLPDQSQSVNEESSETLKKIEQAILRGVRESPPLIRPYASLPGTPKKTPKQKQKMAVEVHVDGPLAVNMDTYLNSTDVSSSVKGNSSGLTNNDSGSVYTAGTGYTGTTGASAYTQSTRVRRPGVAKSRLAKAKEFEDIAKGKGWHDSIRAAAASTNQVWDPEAGWVSYEEKIIDETPSALAQEKIYIDLIKSLNTRKAAKSLEQQAQGDDNKTTSSVPFPPEWAKERSEMIGNPVDLSGNLDNHNDEKKISAVRAQEKIHLNLNSWQNSHKAAKSDDQPTEGGSMARNVTPVSFPNEWEKERSDMIRIPVDRSHNEEKQLAAVGAQEKAYLNPKMQQNSHNAAKPDQQTGGSVTSNTTPVPYPKEYAKQRSVMSRSAVDRSRDFDNHHEEKKFEPLVVRGTRLDTSSQESTAPRGWLASMKAASAILAKEGKIWDPEHGWTRPGSNNEATPDYVDFDGPRETSYDESEGNAGGSLIIVAAAPVDSDEVGVPLRSLSSTVGTSDSQNIETRSLPSLPPSRKDASRSRHQRVSKLESQFIPVVRPSSADSDFGTNQRVATAESQFLPVAAPSPRESDKELNQRISKSEPPLLPVVSPSSNDSDKTQVPPSVKDPDKNLNRQSAKPDWRPLPPAPQSAKDSDKKLNQWIAKVEQGPRKHSELSAESSDKAVASAGATTEAYMQLGDNGSVHPHGHDVLTGTAKENALIGSDVAGKRSRVAAIESSYISDDDDTEVESVPLLSASTAFPTLDETPISPVANIVKEKVGEEDMDLFPQERPKPKHVISVVNRFPEEEIEYNSDEVTYEQHENGAGSTSSIIDGQGNSVASSPSSKRRGAGPIDADEVDETWDSDDDQRSSSRWSLPKQPEPQSPGAGLKKPIPKLRGSKRDTSPVSKRTPTRRTPSKRDGALVTPSPDGTPEHPPMLPKERIVPVESSRIQRAESPPLSPESESVKARRERWEKSGQKILDDLNLQEKTRHGKATPGTAEWKSFLGKKVRAESAAAARSSVNVASHPGKLDPGESKPATVSAEESGDDDSLFEFSEKRLNAKAGGQDSSTFQSDLSPIRSRDEPIRSRDVPIRTRDEPIRTRDEPIRTRDEPIRTRDVPIRTRDVPIRTRDEPIRTRDEPIRTRDDYERATSEAYGPEEGDRSNFFKRLSECATPVMPSNMPQRFLPCAQPGLVDDREEDLDSDDRKPRSQSAPRPFKSQSNEFNSTSSVVSAEDFGAKTAYLEALAMKAAVSKPRSSSRKRSSNSSVVSSSSSVHSAKWQAFLERKRATGAPISSRSSNTSEVSRAAEKYASDKVEEMMSKMSRSKSAKRGSSDNELANVVLHKTESVKAAEDLAAARVEAMMAALSNSHQVDEGEI